MIGSTELIVIVIALLIMFGGKDIQKIMKNFFKAVNKARDFKI